MADLVPQERTTLFDILFYISEVASASLLLFIFLYYNKEMRLLLFMFRGLWHDTTEDVIHESQDVIHTTLDWLFSKEAVTRLASSLFFCPKTLYASETINQRPTANQTYVDTLSSDTRWR